MHNNSYYILDLACNTKETGPIFPQVQKMSKGYDHMAENATRKLFKHWKSFPDFTPNLDSFVLEEKSNPTDFLSNSLSSRGLIVSNKVKDILTSAKTCPVRFYKANIKHKNNFLEGYFWMHVISDYTDFVDYRNSIFFIYQNFMHNLGYIKVSNKVDLLEKEAKLKADNPDHTLAIWAKQIRMLATFDSKLDFFSIGWFNASTYISKQLLNRFEAEKISGYKIDLATNLLT